MATLPPDPEGTINPYAPPEAQIGEGSLSPSGDLSEVESIRRKFLSHEASIKSVGSLHYLGAIITLLAAIGMGAILVTTNDSGSRAVLSGLVAVYVIMAGINFALGRGLRLLEPWSRWVESVVIGLGVLSVVISVATAVAFNRDEVVPSVGGGAVVGLVYGYVLYLLLSSKGATVFSPAYKDVIARTPHIKYKTSCLVKFFILFVVGVLSLAVVGALVGKR